MVRAFSRRAGSGWCGHLFYRTRRRPFRFPLSSPNRAHPREVRLVDVPRDLELEHEHGKLRGDLEVVRRYGDAHPDAWVGLRFENDPPVRIVALFAGGEL